MNVILEKYGYAPDMEAIDRILTQIQNNLDNYESQENLAACMGLIDLTSLNSSDTEAKITALTQKVNNAKSNFPEYPLPASICIYPNFARTVKEVKTEDEVHITAVAACFPTSQSYLEVKVRECELAVENGADEIDIVLALNHFLAGDYEKTSEEIRAVREAIDRVAASQGRQVHLKVILETGLLLKHEAIAAASFLAMEAGADFIKTSTGKVNVNATPAAAYVMCECIAKYYGATGRKVGFKPAGGISTSLDAVSYYSIVSSILGKDWLNKELFRFGVSRLANSILSDLEQRTVSYF